MNDLDALKILLAAVESINWTFELKAACGITDPVWGDQNYEQTKAVIEQAKAVVAEIVANGEQLEAETSIFNRIQTVAGSHTLVLPWYTDTDGVKERLKSILQSKGEDDSAVDALTDETVLDACRDLVEDLLLGNEHDSAEKEVTAALYDACRQFETAAAERLLKAGVLS